MLPVQQAAALPTFFITLSIFARVVSGLGHDQQLVQENELYWPAGTLLVLRFGYKMEGTGSRTQTFLLYFLLRFLLK
jgi:hypothetical protein